MRRFKPAFAFLTTVLALAACDGAGGAETTTTATTMPQVSTTTTTTFDPCEKGSLEGQFEVDLDGQAPSEMIYLLASPTEDQFELGLCIDGDIDSTVELQGQGTEVVGFVDLDDDGRKEVILQAREEDRTLVRAVTSTLRGLAVTSLAAERWIESPEGVPPTGPFSARGVECADFDGDDSLDLVLADYQPAEDLVHVDVAFVDLTEHATAVEIGFDSYETDVTTAFDRWSTPLECGSGSESTTGVRYGANGWGRVDYGEAFDSRGDLVLTAVAHGRERFVAVGYEQPSPLVGEFFPTAQAIWHSANGIDWARSSIEALGELRDVIALDGNSGFIAVGQTDTGSAAVWSSDDADSWELVEVEPGPGLGSARMLGIVQGPDGALVAAGVEMYLPDPSGPGPDLDAAVWRSEDGETWQRVESPPLGRVGYQPNNEGEFNGEIVDVDYRPGVGYVAVGSASRSGDDEIDFPTQYPAVWVSPDGWSWQRHPLEGEFRLRGVTAAAGAIVAHGVSTLQGSPTADAVILISEDGVAWAETTGEFDGLDTPDGIQSINDVVEIPGVGLFALGSDDVEFETKGAAAVWRAAVGQPGEWTRETHDDSVFETVAESPTAVMTHGTWTGDLLLVVGFSGESEVLENGATACCAISPAVWIWEEGRTP
jgi:hypothetical protein